jgi:phenylacetate-CoA ligase
LLNADMPLIRYRLGDRGALAPDTPCPCGRRLPTLAALAGRIDEVIYTTDGRPLGRLDSILRTRVPIREAQIVQETLDRVRVRLVPAPGFTQSAVDEITSRLQARLGQVQVIIESLPEVPRTANGKFRAVICQVPRAEVERRRAAAPVPVS